jgi:hypothetical protein
LLPFRTCTLNLFRRTPRYVAKRLRPRDCALLYQRDMSSMATQVAIELPNIA